MARQSSPRRLSRAEEVAAKVEDEILAARLSVGSSLGRRTELMERFRISPTVTNEVLRILRNRGLVEVRRGNRGGIFVASLPPQVRLGGIDLWFNDFGSNPLQLFEARVHLEEVLTRVAFERATGEDHKRMWDAVARLESNGTRSARAFLEGIFEVHRSIVVASHVDFLIDMHRLTLTLLTGTLTRASFVEGYEPLLDASVAVHRGIVSSIVRRERLEFETRLGDHTEQLVRMDDPTRSPDHVAGY